MVFKLFGFKGSLLGRRKEPKESDDGIVCIGYKVNQEYLESLPPPVLQNNPQASTSKGANPRDPRSLERAKPNGSVPQGVTTTKKQATPPSRNAQNINRKEVVKERKPVTKPAAKDLFKETRLNDDEKDKRKDETVNTITKQSSPVNAEVNVAITKQSSPVNAEVNVASKNEPAPSDSDNDRKSTLIFLTENHDDNARETDQDRHSNLYEEMDVTKFRRRSSAESEIKIGFQSSTGSDSKNNYGGRSSDGEIDFAQSNRFASKDHGASEEYSESPEMYSSQANSLFFGDPEPETVILEKKTKRAAPGRPSQANSETSA